MPASASGGVEDARGPEVLLEAGRHLEDAALALAFAENVGAARVSHVLAPDRDARVAGHLVAERGIDEIDHRRRLSREGGRLFRVEGGRSRVHVGRIDVRLDGLGRGLGPRGGGVRGGVHLGADLLAQLREVLGRGDPRLLEEGREQLERVAIPVLLAFLLGPVELLVVGERVRVGANDVRMDEGRPLPVARVGERVLQRIVRGQKVAAVGLGDEEAGIRTHELRDGAAGRVHLDGHRDRIAVVLHDEDDGELQRARRVQRLPELAFRGGALSDRDDDNFVRRRVRDRAGKAGRLLTQEIAAGLGRSDAGQALGARGRRGREDAQRGRAPVRGHLPPRRRRVVRGAEGLQEHVPRRHPEAEADRAVAVVREEPVRPLPHVERDRRLDRLVPRAADLEEDPALALELDLLVVDPAGRDHVPVRPEKILARKPFV